MFQPRVRFFAQHRGMAPCVSEPCSVDYDLVRRGLGATGTERAFTGRGSRAAASLSSSAASTRACAARLRMRLAVSSNQGRARTPELPHPQGHQRPRLRTNQRAQCALQQTHRARGGFQPWLPRAWWSHLLMRSQICCQTSWCVRGGVCEAGVARRASGWHCLLQNALRTPPTRQRKRRSEKASPLLAACFGPGRPPLSAGGMLQDQASLS